MAYCVYGVLFLAPLMALYGFRGETFHWWRIPWVYLGVLLVWWVCLPPMDLASLTFFATFGTVSVATVVGFIGEPFHTRRFTEDYAPVELSYLFRSWSSTVVCIAVVLGALVCAYPLIVATVAHFVKQILGPVLIFIMVAVVFYVFFYRDKPAVVKDSIDHLATDKGQAAAFCVANHGVGVLAGDTITSTTKLQPWNG